MNSIIKPAKATHSLALCVAYWDVTAEGGEIRSFLTGSDFLASILPGMEKEEKHGAIGYKASYKIAGRTFWSVGYRIRQVTLECFEYSGWQDFMYAAKSLAEPLFHHFDGAVKNCGIYFGDEFLISAKSRDSFDLLTLLKAGTSYIPDEFFRATICPVSSVFRFGIPINIEGFAEAVNIISAELKKEEQNLRFALTQDLSSCEVPTYSGGKPLLPRYEKLLEAFHKINKCALREILTHPVLDKIGIDNA